MAQIKFVPTRRPKPRELSELMQTLPQELFDDIYNLTFTAEPGLRDLGRICSHNWGRSFVRYHRGQQFLGADTRALLQVDRASRAEYASTYYGEGSIFIAHTAYAAMTWMHSVAPEHRSLIAALPPKLAWAGFGVGGHGPHQILRADHNGWEKIRVVLRQMRFVSVPTKKEFDDICCRPVRSTAADIGTAMKWTHGPGLRRY